MAVAQTVPIDVATTPTKQYVHAIGYLRAFAVALVVAHHAVLAYHPFAPAPLSSLTAEPRWWPAFPVVDAERWGGFGAFVGFNDLFLMSLLFFLSGLCLSGIRCNANTAPDSCATVFCASACRLS